jgi:hypothetical protein
MVAQFDIIKLRDNDTRQVRRYKRDGKEKGAEKNNNKIK